MPKKSIRVFFYIPTQQTDQPIAYTLVKQFDLVFSILHAEIKPNKSGKLTLVLEGEEKNITDALNFVEAQGIQYKIFKQNILWKEDVCVHCGACTSVCPSGALSMNESTEWKLEFDNTKCLICEQCVATCPTKAIDINQFL